MTINKGKRPIKRELGNQELKIPAQQNKKGNEKVRSPVCKCVLAHAGDGAFPRRGRRPFILTFQVEWTMTNTISVNCRERTQSCWNWLPLSLGQGTWLEKPCCSWSYVASLHFSQKVPRNRIFPSGFTSICLKRWHLISHTVAMVLQHLSVNWLILENN